MRPIELIFCVLTMLAALFTLLPSIPDKYKFRVIPGIVVLTGFAQAVLEGFRWQLWPAVVGAALVVLTGMIDRTKFGLINTSSVLLVFIGLLAVVSLAAAWLLPIPEPYAISGPYQVGTRVFPLVDETRNELYGQNPEAKREIMVQVWYPASPTAENEQGTWMPDIQYAGPALAEYIELPRFMLNHLEYARGNSFVDAPVSADGADFPVLIFSHGWSGFREQNFYQVEELASHGYVVAAISHTYGAILTVFPDGRQMAKNEAALPDGVTEEEYALASNLLVRQWAGDIGFVLDELAQLDQSADWPLAGRLDMSKVGVFGHSTGGGAAAEFCGVDARCGAALMMDLWVEPVSDAVVEAGLSQPFMLLHSAAWVDLEEHSENYQRDVSLIEASSGEVIEIRIAGTEHHDFSSLPLLTPLAHALGLKGPIEGDRGLQLINYFSVAFFDQYLLGVDEGLLAEDISPFVEAEFISRPE
jgi:predicted dienelactone hydrolase